MIMNSDGENLTGLWFEDSRDLSKHIIDCEELLTLERNDMSKFFVPKRGTAL